MKYIISILLIYYTTEVNSIYHVHPSLDQLTITLLAATSQCDTIKSTVALKYVSDKWTELKSDILTSDLFDNIEFIEIIEATLYKISSYIDNRIYPEAEHLTYQLLWDFYYMRSCIGIAYYPHDQLLQTHHIYKELHHIIHDEIMDLRSWPEFQDIVEYFVHSWGIYDCIDETDIQKYFPGIDINIHRESKHRLQYHLSHFVKSMDSGNYRSAKGGA